MAETRVLPGWKSADFCPSSQQRSGVIAEAIWMAEMRKVQEATPHEDLAEGRLSKVLPVRIPDFDVAAQRGTVAAPAERPTVEHLPEDIQFEERREERGRGTRPPVERLPKDIEPREERRRPGVENLPEDFPAQKATREQKKNWDVLDEETKASQRQLAEKKKKGSEEEWMF